MLPMTLLSHPPMTGKFPLKWNIPSDKCNFLLLNRKSKV
jgi:hypothetical protein